MKDIPKEDVLQVLGCQIEKRPDAPGMHDLAPFVTSVARDSSAVTVLFKPEAQAAVAAFVQAEQQCCGGIGWELDSGPDVRLRIAAETTAFDAISKMFQLLNIEEVR